MDGQLTETQAPQNVPITSCAQNVSLTSLVAIMQEPLQQSKNLHLLPQIHHSYEGYHLPRSTAHTTKPALVSSSHEHLSSQPPKPPSKKRSSSTKNALTNDKQCHSHVTSTSKKIHPPTQTGRSKHANETVSQLEN